MFQPLSSFTYALLTIISLFGMLSMGAPLANTTSSLTQRDAVQSCWYDNWNVFIEWSIHLNNDNQFDRSGCGRGFLDNFRGRCGAITNWSCLYDEGDDIYMDFLTSEFCSYDDISAAINAASYGKLNIPCIWILDVGSSE